MAEDTTFEGRTGAEVAVIGMSCRFPGASDPDELWFNLRSGVESVTELERDEIEPSSFGPEPWDDPSYVPVAAILEDYDRFDAGFFGLTPQEAEMMDPQQRLFLQEAWHALEHAGYDPRRHDAPVGVFAGASTNTYIFNLFSNQRAMAGLDLFEVGLHNDLAFLANRVSYALDLRGPSVSVHTACSTALVAVHLARQSLLIDECRMALAGAASVRVPHKGGYLYRPGGVVSSDGRTRTFDEEGEGTLFGNGVGVVVVKRLEDALEDGDRIHAVIRGSAANNDGSLKAGFTAPSVQGQTDVLLEALADAEVEPDSISYVEAHGTGTPLGDPIEIRALGRAYGGGKSGARCALGSVKTNFGHLDSAAGVAGLIKSILCLEHGELVPSLHFETPNPQIDFDATPFYVTCETRPWERDGGARRAGLSAFGVGGTNVHLILEEPPAPRRPTPAEPWQLLAFSAKTPEALDQVSENLAEHLEESPDENLADVAYTLQVGRSELPYRRCLVCRDASDAAMPLRENDSRMVRSRFQERGDREVVFLFPGGGAQYRQMARGLLETEPVFRDEIERCAARLDEKHDIDVRSVLQGDDRPEGNRTVEAPRLALPSLFAVEYALGRLLLSWGLRPAAMLGHSLGEYTAACLAGVFEIEDALDVVAKRAELFSRLRGHGMLSVGLGEEELSERLGEGLAIAAVNAPDLCLVAGADEAVDRLAEELAAEDVDTRRLHLELASHSPDVEPFLPEFREYLERFELHPPEVPVISNLTGEEATEEELTDPEYWVRHIRHAVRFADGVRVAREGGERVLLEVGPGRTLTTLGLANATGAEPGDFVQTLPGPDERRPARRALLEAVGSLWLAGVPMDWRVLHDEESRRRLALPTYPFARERFWIEPGEGGSVDRRRGSGGKAGQVADWFHLPGWRPTGLLSPRLGDDAAAGPWLILADEHGLGEALGELLRDRGETVRVAIPGEEFRALDDGRFEVRPDRRADYEALLEAFGDAGPERIVHLWSAGGDASDPSGAWLFRREQRTGFYSVLHLCQALVDSGLESGVEIGLVSDRMLDFGGDPVLAPEKSPMVGASRVIAQEEEHLAFRWIDVDPRSVDSTPERSLLEAIVAELTSEEPRAPVALRGARRWTRTFEPLRLTDSDEPARPLREGGSYLITGGLGGVGLLLAEHLAETCRAKLTLTARSAFPPREEWADPDTRRFGDERTARVVERLRAMEAAGAEVTVEQADVADEPSMRRVVERMVKRTGGVDGVLHTAGVTAGPSLYRSFMEFGAEEAETQFQPKVYGLYVLERVIEEHAPDFCVLFSSSSSVLGGLGYTNYAAASLFMDSFAASRSGRSRTHWISADWDAWPEETRRYDVQTSMDRYTMSREEGAEAFRRVACSAPEGRVVCVVGDLEERLALWVERAGGSAGSGELHERPADLASPYVEPETETERSIAEIWESVLGIDQVGLRDNFFDLGGHSLLATRLVARLNDAFDVDLPLGDFFEDPTVEAVAGLVEKSRGPEDEESAQILEALSRFSEEEIEEELRRREESVEEEA